MNDHKFKILPGDNELPVQMSPFSDDRWEIDRLENQRRREIHRSYVYNTDRAKAQKQAQEILEKPPQKHHPQQQVSQPTLATEEPASLPPAPPPIPDPAPFEMDNFGLNSSSRDSRRKPALLERKTFKEIPFESPGPVNLYPLLKYPVTRVKPEAPYNLSGRDKWVLSSGTDSYELPPKPQFAVYKDVFPERPKVEHYGIHVPFWQFS